MQAWKRLEWRLKQKWARDVGSPLDFLRVWLELPKRSLKKIRCRGIELSVISCVRNRMGLRERNCLQSFLRQSLPRECYEIIVVDYGSDDPTAMKKFIKGVDEGIKYVYVDEHGLFNNARAKNIGLMLARGRNVLHACFDNVFSGNTLDAVLLALENERLLVEIKRYEFPEELIEKTDLINGYEAALKLPGVEFDPTSSDVQAMNRKAMLEVFNGFDEELAGWGGWDTDLRRRAVNKGFKCLNLFPLTTLLHQNHDSLKRREDYGQGYRKNRACIDAKPLSAVKANEAKNWAKDALTYQLE